MSLSTIRDILIADPTINGLVGTNVFVAFATKGVEAPYIILDEVLRTPNDCKGEPSQMDSYRFAVTAVDLRFSTVETLLTASRDALDGYSDADYKWISFDGIQDMYDGTQDYFVNSYMYKSLITV
jgi:hypothetical protein